MKKAVLCLLIASFVGFLHPAFGQTTVSTDSAIVAVKSLYDGGSFISAELQARRMLEDKTISDSARIQFEKYVAFSLVAQNKNESAIEHFINVLKLDSAFTLDPVLTSPKILSVFQTAKGEFTATNISQRPAENQTEPVGNRYGRSGAPTFRAMIFPGWDQLYRGDRGKGYVLLGIGVVSAVSSIASDLLRRNARTDYLNAGTPALASSRYKTYNAYYKTEVYSVSVFVLAYAYSELDSFLNLPPQFSAAYNPVGNTTTLGIHISF